MPIVTRYGWLLDVIGAIRKADGIWFAPVYGDLDDPEKDPTHSLQAHTPIRFYFYCVVNGSERKSLAYNNSGYPDRPGEANHGTPLSGPIG
jgi:hypothetical protein